MRARRVGLLMTLALGACGKFGTADDESGPPSTDATHAADASGPDASAPAADATDASLAVSGFCKDSSAELCDSFDDDVLLPPGFTYVEGFSRPHAVQATTPQGDTTEKIFKWTYDPGKDPTVITVRFRLRIVDLPAGDGENATILHIGCDQETYFELGLKETGELRLESGTGAAANDSDSTNPIEKSQWAEVAIAWAGQRVTLNGAFGSTTLDGDVSADLCQSPLSVTLGFMHWSEGPAGKYTLQFDDYVVDVE